MKTKEQLRRACEWQKQWRLRHGKNRHRPKTKEENRDSNLRRLHKITLAQFNDKLARQGGGCAVCGTMTPGGKGSFHVDHDHKTGKLRDLLCHKCNVALGCVDDNPEILRRLICYLSKHEVTP